MKRGEKHERREYGKQEDIHENVRTWESLVSTRSLASALVVGKLSRERSSGAVSGFVTSGAPNGSLKGP